MVYFTLMSPGFMSFNFLQKLMPHEVCVITLLWGPLVFSLEHLLLP